MTVITISKILLKTSSVNDMLFVKRFVVACFGGLCFFDFNTR
ncbi:hypothetical protein CLV59_106124 [Chitinophaga dinghuensis]|uniref:Uncharacterized protein n=1 Tax=Chitinophaga dinghuensis TaxID=1539050 RepID=A0A327VW56_9BACT|nr:hypothetical protein CLV59_106124 [Chitinophaga dinghuensis]